MNKIILSIGVLVLVVIGVTYTIRNGDILNKSSDKIACTMDAKQCPDGSYVGRSGPKCEFTECPLVKETTQAKIAEKILNNGIYITPQDVVEDSRCPTDVVCVWAGQVRLRVTLQSRDNPIDAQDVTLTPSKPFIFKGQTIELIDVIPSTDSKKIINAGDYRFTFRVILIANIEKGTVSGTVTTSPTCPVERIPPDPQCAPRPYSTSIEIRQIGKTTLIKTIKSDIQGWFNTELSVGQYELRPISSSSFPRCGSVTVQVKSGQNSITDISCDTGIR